MPEYQNGLALAPRDESRLKPGTLPSRIKRAGPAHAQPLRCKGVGLRGGFVVSTVVTSSIDAPSPQDFGEMFNLVSGYRISQAIYVVVELGIPDLLAAGPRPCDELARKTNTHAPTLFRILRFLTGAGLFNELGPGEFELTRLGSTLRTDLAGSFQPAVRFLLIY